MISFIVLVRMRLAVGALLSASAIVCGCGGSSARQVIVRTEASCASLTAAQRYAGARLVVVASALDGRTVRVGSERTLTSPARMRIVRYIKGHGPVIVEVSTAVTTRGLDITVAEDGITPVPGQRWKLFLTGGRPPYETSICAGSKPISTSP